MDEKTLAYYEKNVAYLEKTLAMDMQFHRDRFMMLLPSKAKILDLGCGSGRDLRKFKEAGFQAVGLERTRDFVEFARQYASCEVEFGDALSMPFENRSFDAVWACAVFVHFTKHEFLNALEEIKRVSKNGAVLFLSVKKGEGERRDGDGRLFVLYSVEEVKEQLSLGGFELLVWDENETGEERWINMLCRTPSKGERDARTFLTLESAQRWAGFVLGHAGIEEAQREAGWILKYILACDEKDFFLSRQKTLPAQKEPRFFEMVQKRAARFPLAYLIEERGFMGMDFKVTPDVLIPRPETELLVENALSLAGRKPVIVLDMGTGSGCIAISFAVHHEDSFIVATDISSEALQIAEENGRRHAVEHRILWLKSDLFSALRPSPVFDLILSNPPYVSKEEHPRLMPEVRDHEPSLALLADEGIAFYRKIVPSALLYLKKNGFLVLELGYGQLPSVMDLVPRGLVVHQIVNDYSGIERVLILKKNDGPDGT